jgi:cell fate (sporulation/competence/biofilm development) regulator YlbF (YheA/YmcA/DUF963 family)
MEDTTINTLEIAPVSVVKQAAHDFAAALAESQQFKDFEQTAYRFRRDEDAQKDMQAYREKQQELRPLIQRNAVPPTAQAELEHLHDAWLAHPSVLEYLEAQAELVGLCQSLGDLLSEMVGFDFPAACASSCCG